MLIISFIRQCVQRLAHYFGKFLCSHGRRENPGSLRGTSLRQSPSLAAGADSCQNLFNLWTPTSVSSATCIRQGVAGCGISLRPRSRSPRLLKVPGFSEKEGKWQCRVSLVVFFYSGGPDPARDDGVRSVSSRLLRMFLFSSRGLPSSTQKLHYTILFQAINCQITLFFGFHEIINFYITRSVTLHDWASFVQIRALDGLNPNHDGSSTEREPPKQSSHVRV